MTEATFQGAKPKWKAPAPPTPEEEKITALDAVRKQLEYRDRNFAASLCEQFKKKGFLSDAQWVWVKTLTERATAPKDPAAALPSGFDSIIDMMVNAAAKTSYPRFDFGDKEQPLRLSLNGSGSRYPGAVSITTQHKNFSDRTYFGRIERDGVLHAHANAKRLPELEAQLRAIVADPGAVARAYGAEFKHCSFCDQALTHPSSVKHGYGPICAANYGLPWGD